MSSIVSKIKDIVRPVTVFIKDEIASYYLSRKPEHCNEKIKVGFIAQMPEVWDKLSPVYEKMCDDPAFEPVLVVLPKYDVINERIGGYGYELEFFTNKYPDGIIRKFYDEDFNVRAEKFNYIFVQRQYDFYLPDDLKSQEIVKYSRLCYIRYDGPGLCDFFDKSKTKEFFRNIYIFFTSIPELNEYYSDMFRKDVEKGIKKVVFLGYPVMEKYLLTEKNEGIRNITWAPRWSMDMEFGGSNFLKYKDDMLKFADIPGIHLIIRPHPLMFDNFIKEGYLTQEDVDEYKKKLDEKGVELDLYTDIYDTLKRTDILISDYSSIMSACFAMDRLLIYSPCAEMKKNNEFKDMMTGSYEEYDFAGIEQTVTNLLNGIDPKKQHRDAVISRLKREHLGSTARILDYLKEDNKL